jgi:hypothetical protein
MRCVFESILGGMGPFLIPVFLPQQFHRFLSVSNIPFRGLDIEVLSSYIAGSCNIG